jgi:hypothetical protein
MNILVLYDKFSTYTNTVYEHLDSLGRLSAHNHFYYHGTHPTEKILWHKFDAVVIHYCLRLAHDQLPSILVEEVENFSGLKVLFLQDEYDHTERTRNYIKRLGADVVFTSVPPDIRKDIYPPNRFPKVKFVTTLTGYVSEFYNTTLDIPTIQERNTVIAYRGRSLPFWYGDLGQEKQTIAMVVKDNCIERKIKCDIEWDDDHRIYGDKWIEFLKSSKATLGTESGANVFDYDGQIKESFIQYQEAHPNATYGEARLAVLGTLEEKPIMNQISPRIFEAIAFKTALVLFEGNYSGVIHPYRHYLPLKKDFSNLHQILDMLESDELMQQMVDRTYKDIIVSKKYVFSVLVNKYDELLNITDKKPIILHKSIQFTSNLTQKPQRHRLQTIPHWLRFIWNRFPSQIQYWLKPIAVSIFKRILTQVRSLK